MKEEEGVNNYNHRFRFKERLYSMLLIFFDKPLILKGEKNKWRYLLTLEKQ